MEAEQVVRAEPPPAAWQPAEPVAAPARSATPPGGTKFAWLDVPSPGPEGARAPLPPPVQPRPIEHEGTVETRMPAKRLSMGRLALYVAAGMLVLYLLGKMLG